MGAIRHGTGRLALGVGALGVVFGDIWTSPLYTEQTVFSPSDPHPVQVSQESVFGLLHQGIHLLPYGAGTTVRHVVGSDQGGGYEWKKPAGRPSPGIIALELGGNGLITRLTAMWDGSMADQAQLAALLRATIE